jgi:Ca2+-binding EF-hand superfamily protein
MAHFIKAIRASTLVIAFSFAGLCSAYAADELGGLEFDTVDADANGEVSFVEIVAVAPNASQSVFDAFDADSSGGLDRSEYSAWLDSFVGRTPNDA